MIECFDFRLFDNFVSIVNLTSFMFLTAAWSYHKTS